MVWITRLLYSHGLQNVYTIIRNHLGCQALVKTSERRDAQSGLLTSNICRPGILAKVSTAMALDDTIWYDLL